MAFSREKTAADLKGSSSLERCEEKLTVGSCKSHCWACRECVLQSLGMSLHSADSSWESKGNLRVAASRGLWHYEREDGRGVMCSCSGFPWRSWAHSVGGHPLRAQKSQGDVFRSLREMGSVHEAVFVLCINEWKGGGSDIFSWLTNGTPYVMPTCCNHEWPQPPGSTHFLLCASPRKRAHKMRLEKNRKCHCCWASFKRTGEKPAQGGGL